MENLILETSEIYHVLIIMSKLTGFMEKPVLIPKGNAGEQYNSVNIFMNFYMVCAG